MEWKRIADGSLPKDGQRVFFCDERHPDQIGVGVYLDEDAREWIDSGGYWLEPPPLPTPSNA